MSETIHLRFPGYKIQRTASSEEGRREMAREAFREYLDRHDAGFRVWLERAASEGEK